MSKILRLVFCTHLQYQFQWIWWPCYPSLVDNNASSSDYLTSYLYPPPLRVVGSLGFPGRLSEVQCSIERAQEELDMIRVTIAEKDTQLLHAHDQLLWVNFTLLLNFGLTLVRCLTHTHTLHTEDWDSVLHMFWQDWNRWTFASHVITLIYHVTTGMKYPPNWWTSFNLWSTMEMWKGECSMKNVMPFLYFCNYALIF